MSHEQLGLVQPDRPVLRWNDRDHWNGGRRAPCRICGEPAFLLDHAGIPAHKVCVEAALESV